MGTCAMNALNPFFVCVNEIDKGEDVTAIGETEFAFAFFEARFGVGLVAAAIEDVAVESGLVSSRLVDVMRNPVADFAVRDGGFDNFDEVLRMEPGRFEPQPVEALSKVGLVIGGEFPGAMEADFIDEAGQVDPASHAFAGATGINDGAHEHDGCRTESVRKTECTASGVRWRSVLVQFMLESGSRAMTWYFVDRGQQAGPVSDVQLDEHILGGKILPETLVWREGMENWQHCR